MFQQLNFSLMLKRLRNMDDFLMVCYSGVQLFDVSVILNFHDNMVKMFYDRYLRGWCEYFSSGYSSDGDRILGVVV